MDMAVAELILQQAVDLLEMDISRTDSNVFKLRTAAEQVKKDLSAAGADDTSYSVQCIVDDEDADGEVTKEDMESACKREGDLFERFYHFVFSMIGECASDVHIDAVEISGSSMRIPMLRTKLLEAVQHNGHDVSRVSNTLNMEEACARGCALFAQKYLVEKRIVCTPEHVSLKSDNTEVTMDVCGCKSTDPVEGKFAVSGTVSLKTGTDHDCRRICMN